jgi:hypothetical protein
MSFQHQLEDGPPTCGCGRCVVSLSRRQAVALAATAMGMITILGARSAVAQSAPSPEAALAQLMDGNARFVPRAVQTVGRIHASPILGGLHHLISNMSGSDFRQG